MNRMMSNKTVYIMTFVMVWLSAAPRVLIIFHAASKFMPHDLLLTLRRLSAARGAQEA